MRLQNESQGCGCACLPHHEKRQVTSFFAVQGILKCFGGRREAEIVENRSKVYAQIRSEIPANNAQDAAQHLCGDGSVRVSRFSLMGLPQ